MKRYIIKIVLDSKSFYESLGSLRGVLQPSLIQWQENTPAEAMETFIDELIEDEIEIIEFIPEMKILEDDVVILIRQDGPYTFVIEENPRDFSELLFRE